MDTRLVVDSFVELADTLAQGYDTSDFLHLLVDRCVETFDITAAGVFLASNGGLGLAAASNPAMEQVQQYEREHDEGPCREAFRTGEAVVQDDFEQALERWPGFAPRALELGFRAGYAFPLKLRDDVIGALNLYRTSVGPFGDLERRVTRGYADVATIGILQERQAREAGVRSAQLQHALDSRIVIEQAKGVLAGRYGVPPDAAFEAIRSYARSRRLKLHDVCHTIINDAVPEGLRLG